MKVLITLLLFIVSSQFYGQSKAESQDWITSKYNDYERTVNKKFDLEFEDGYLMYLIFDDLFRVQIKDILRMEIKAEKWDSADKIGWTSIYIYFQKGKLSIKQYGENSFTTDSGDTFFKIPLKSEFISDGLKPRMEKAFVHLIKLYGGSATIKKEAF